MPDKKNLKRRNEYDNFFPSISSYFTKYCFPPGHTFVFLVFIIITVYLQEVRPPHCCQSSLLPSTCSSDSLQVRSIKAVPYYISPGGKKKMFFKDNQDTRTPAGKVQNGKPKTRQANVPEEFPGF